MSRVTWKVDDDRDVVMGYDPPFRSWFAQLWDKRHDPDPDGAPKAAVGYHPAEQARPPIAAEYGPYPIDSAEDLSAYMAEHWSVVIPAYIWEALS
jgi:hypothetical protein